jgi:hypothetical protein
MIKVLISMLLYKKLKLKNFWWKIYGKEKCIDMNHIPFV